MGCWNDTCFVTNLPVFAGDPVEVLLLRSEVKSHPGESISYPTENWTPYKFTFHGKYDDYGKVEDCKGAALPLLVDAITENLVEQDAVLSDYGSPPHVFEPAVTRESLTIGKILDSEQSGRLKVYKWEDAKSYMNTESEDECYVKHVVIHRKVYQKIVKNFAFEVSSRFNIGKKKYDEDWAPKLVKKSDVMKLYDDFVNDSNSDAAEIVREFMVLDNGFSNPYFPQLNRYNLKTQEDALKRLEQLRDHGMGEVLRSDRKVFENAVEMMVFNVYMHWGRKVYAIPSGAGSQNSDVNAQMLCAKLTLDQANVILEDQRKYAEE
jgi:hypothetical protein